MAIRKLARAAGTLRGILSMAKLDRPNCDGWWWARDKDGEDHFVEVEGDKVRELHKVHFMNMADLSDWRGPVTLDDPYWFKP